MKVFSTIPKCFHYIPLISCLEQLLSHPKVLAMIGELQKCRSGYLYEIIDGELMKSHPSFSAQPSALQIILYSDKTLGNINPKYRSELAAILLLAITKKSELLECGVDGILSRLHEDLVTLYDGVKIQTGNGER